MAPLYDVITFDCYGTLIDWENGIGTAFANAAAIDGRQLDRTQVLKAYGEIEPSVEAERYRTYREVLTDTAQRVAERFSWPSIAAQMKDVYEWVGGLRAAPCTVTFD